VFLDSCESVRCWEGNVNQSFEDGIRRLYLAGHHEEAVDSIVRAWRPPLFGYLRLLLANEADAEDVLQDTFTRVTKGLDSFQGWASAQPPHGAPKPMGLRAWVYRIATNCALTLKRARDRAKERLSHPSALSAAGQSPDVIGSNLGTEQKDVLAAFSERDLWVNHLLHHVGFCWRDVTAIVLAEEDPDAALDEARLKRATNALKKQQERLIDRLRPFARAKGVGAG
jgi:DNA-directed RNA polymerase specialized sigma24 family protein